LLAHSLARPLLSRFADEFLRSTNVRTFIIIGALAFASAANADPIPGGAGDFSRGYGMGWESFDTSINPSTRDENGNRVIVNGRMEIEGSLSGGLQDSFATGLGASSAIGNQLNVITQGNYNTVIVDSTQINNGDITAVVGDE